MISRRAFLGTMVATPMIAPIIGEGGMAPNTPLKPPQNRVEIAVPFSENVKRGGYRFNLGVDLTGRYFFRLVQRHLRDLPMQVVGGQEAMVGHTWGSGTFTKQVYCLVPNMLWTLDRVMYDDLARLYADRIRAEGLRFVGRPPLPSGGVISHHYENKKFAMRFVTQYDHDWDGQMGRFDVIGSGAIT